ncbi:sigma-54 interaction domain-containing protein [Thiothrix nivea]|uniref:Sigma54 specific transcriptional regulator, Fis family n=1 Tax=Thiothrix nivea (strain ATCC 35100 / DSM 5205 / JP2) TaxID=870187 RepID=A0A656HEY7_THINJ|nr:sigma-54-dependent Fis family transcriptional regulator [Thiothrix nivea]EIJ35488.1 sigma54 specific transcriptional regulator, Fis family [Thiothrix nivea DSM 5205]
MEPEQLSSNSPTMREVLRAAMQVARTDACVLILGESGTGKERIARAIHAASPRQQQAFITVNCATLPNTLAESLLFGHTKGAFTGATDNNPGLIASADGGTLFLDEIGELPLALQPKLLRFLESGEILPVGKTRPQRVNVRVLAATHCDLAGMVAEGTFRGDLFHRINVIPLALPPLYQRKEDIGQLLRYFLTQFADQHRQPVSIMGQDAMSLLLEYRWPGNVRELRNLCEQLSILKSGQNIQPDDLLHALRHPVPTDTANNPFKLPENGINLEEMERHLLIQALERTRNNKTQAARLLGISRDALNYRLKKHALA